MLCVIVGPKLAWWKSRRRGVAWPSLFVSFGCVKDVLQRALPVYIHVAQLIQMDVCAMSITVDGMP